MRLCWKPMLTIRAIKRRRAFWRDVWFVSESHVFTSSSLAGRMILNLFTSSNIMYYSPEEIATVQTCKEGFTGDVTCRSIRWHRSRWIFVLKLEMDLGLIMRRDKDGVRYFDAAFKCCNIAFDRFTVDSAHFA